MSGLPSPLCSLVPSQLYLAPVTVLRGLDPHGRLPLAPPVGLSSPGPATGRDQLAPVGSGSTMTRRSVTLTGRRCAGRRSRTDPACALGCRRAPAAPARA